MGTRHLIRVIDEDGALKVAQYGQWDGYPEGVGTELLGVLEELGFSDRGKRHEFHLALQKTEFVGGDAIDIINQGLEDLQGDLKEIVPAMSRDTSEEVLKIIAGLAPCGDERLAKTPTGELWLQNENEFGQDGTFCEWLYEVNLQEDKLHVRHNDKGDVIASFELGRLPDPHSFVAMINGIVEARHAEEND